MFMGWTEHDKKIGFDRMVCEAVAHFEDNYKVSAAVVVTAENFRGCKATFNPKLVIRVGKRPIPQTYLIWIGDASELVEAL